MISNATEEAQRILREAKEYADQTMRDFQKFGKRMFPSAKWSRNVPLCVKR